MESHLGVEPEFPIFNFQSSVFSLTGVIVVGLLFIPLCLTSIQMCDPLRATGGDAKLKTGDSGSTHGCSIKEYPYAAVCVEPAALLHEVDCSFQTVGDAKRDAAARHETEPTTGGDAGADKRIRGQVARAGIPAAPDAPKPRRHAPWRLSARPGVRRCRATAETSPVHARRS